MTRSDHRKHRRRITAAMGNLLVVALSASSCNIGAAFQQDLWPLRTTTFTAASFDHSCLMNELFAVNPNKPGSTKKRATAALGGTRRKNGTQKRAGAQEVQKESATNNRIRITQRRGWGDRIKQLRSFRKANGHCWVTARHEEKYPGLHQWIRTLRRDYRHQVRVVQDDNNNDHNTNTNTNKIQQCLPPEKLQQLAELGFVWEPQKAGWQRRFAELQRFHAAHGHCRVPNNSLEYPGLGIWVRNQRREYAKLTKHQPPATAATDEDGEDDNTAGSTEGRSNGSGSALTPARLRALEELDFEWFQSYKDAWQTRYEQLVQYYSQHGHSNVPQPQTYGDAPSDQDSDADEQQVQLGTWCMNQRAKYRSYLAGQPTALTRERIEKLEAINFQWNVRRYKWKRMLQRLQNYHKVHGHVNIAVNDTINDDLRLWLTWQRYLYNCRQNDAAATATSGDNNSNAQRPSPLTDDRIKALENAIPKFRWKVRAGNSGGPSSKDWAELFDALRDKGFQPGMRPKQHWFEGINPFAMAVKSTYTEEDLLELWHQDADDGEEVLDDGVGVSLEADPWYDD